MSIQICCQTGGFVLDINTADLHKVTAIDNEKLCNVISLRVSMVSWLRFGVVHCSQASFQWLCHLCFEQRP